MNIFVTNYCPKQCALEHCLVHRNKMLVEYAQIMSTVNWLKGRNKGFMYKPTHEKHPSVLWALASDGNYMWLYKLWNELSKLYTLYTGKIHQSFERCSSGLYLDCNEQPSFPVSMLAMPDEYKRDNVLTSYHVYLSAKFKEWQNRDKPIAIQFHDKQPDWLEGRSNYD